MSTVRSLAVDVRAPAATSPSRRIDWGRTVMVPISVVLGALAVLRLGVLLTNGARLTDGARPGDVGLAAVTGVLTAAFYLLIVRAYLRRGPARTTSRVPLALLAGPVATFVPFALPFAGSGGQPAGDLLLGNLLLAAGFGFSVWSLRCLDRSLSVVPQARQLVQHGPYARVRHPLYLGELLAMLGLALTLGGPAPLLLWAALAGLQAYRAVQEESLLRECLPGYAGYQARTARILPGVF